MWGRKPNGKKKAKALHKALLRAQQASPPPPDEAVFRYLEEVYRIRTQYTASQIRQALGADRWAKRLHTRPTAVGLLIGATAGLHITGGLRWKYMNALEFARKNKVPSKELREFIRANGGINACVIKHRQLLKPTPDPTVPQQRVAAEVDHPPLPPNSP
jgi:hypothetical protein